MPVSIQGLGDYLKRSIGFTKQLIEVLRVVPPQHFNIKYLIVYKNNLLIDILIQKETGKNILRTHWSETFSKIQKYPSWPKAF